MPVEVVDSLTAYGLAEDAEDVYDHIILPAISEVVKSKTTAVNYSGTRQSECEICGREEGGGGGEGRVTYHHLIPVKSLISS